MRAQLQAKKVWLSHKAVVHHVMGHTSSKVPGFGREMTIRNSIYLFYKDLPGGVLLRVLPRFVYSNLRLTLAAIVKGHPWRAIRAQLTALVHIPAVLIRRHRIQKNRKLSSKQFGEMLSRDNPFKVLADRK
jgi:alpha-D-ribose 1-methylphosphonate 5-triphosphate synthase subunit PhnI